MWHKGALSKLKSLMLTAAALFLAAGSQTARAQVLFDDIDWNLDRGSFTYAPAPQDANGAARRLGYNGFTITVPDPNQGGNIAGIQPYEDSPYNNNPGYAVRRWVWPATADLINNGQIQYTCDNPFPGDGLNGFGGDTLKAGTGAIPNDPNYGVTENISVGQQPTDAIVGGNWPTQENVFNNGQWFIPLQANRVQGGGFGFGFNRS